MTPIQSLIDQLQAAEHGTPELSEAMAVALGWGRVSVPKGPQYWSCDGLFAHSSPPPLTTDLGAILAEIERVFPGYYSFGRTVSGAYCTEIDVPSCALLVNETHPTSPPLAACIALLRALEARDKANV